MIVQARVPCPGLAPGARVDPHSAPVRDPSRVEQVGRVTFARCVERGWLELTIELDDGPLATRISETRSVF